MFISFLHFFISFKYDFHVDAEKMIVKCEKCKGIDASMVLKKMNGTIPFLYGRIADICRLWSIKLIFIGYGQLNSTTVLDFLHQARMTIAI